MSMDSARRLGCTCSWHGEYATLSHTCPLHSKERQLPLEYDWNKTIKPDARYGGEWMPSGNAELELIGALSTGGTVTLPEDSVTVTASTYDPTEQDVLIRVFSDMLRTVTKDGGRKRASGLKPGWYADPEHEAAIYSHLSKWKHGETVDVDSGAHPLVHLAWRSLAIAYQETYGKRDPQVYWAQDYGVHNG